MYEDSPPEGKHACVCKWARDNAGSPAWEEWYNPDTKEYEMRYFLVECPVGCVICNDTGWCY